MSFKSRVLGRTGLSVGPIGISASYGVPATAIERAFDAGMNYLYWGSRRTPAFATALRRLAPKRDRVVLVLQSYSRLPALMRRSVERGLAQIGYGHADVLLLGFWNKPIHPRILDEARTLQRRSLVNFIAVSSHNRPIAAAFAAAGDVDAVHVRYNAAHPGAEADFFPVLPAADRPGVVSFTGTSWGQLLDPRFAPPGEQTPTAADCYRFVLSHPDVNVCATGPASAQHVEDGIAACEAGPMSQDELAWMKRVGHEVRRRAWLKQ